MVQHPPAEPMGGDDADRTRDVSVADAARLIGRSATAVRWMVNNGRLRARKVDNRWLVDRADVERRRAELLDALAVGVDVPGRRDFGLGEVDRLRQDNERLRATVAALENEVRTLRALNQSLMAADAEMTDALRHTVAAAAAKHDVLVQLTMEATVSE